MKRLRILRKALNVFVLLMAISPPSMAFVKVVNWVSSPTLVFENKNQATLSKDLLIKSPFVVVTNKNDKLDLIMNSFDKVSIYPETKIQVLEFSEDLAYVSDLYILDGIIRFKSEVRNAAATTPVIRLRTPFLDIKTDFLADFIINLNMSEPSVEIQLISGAMTLNFFEYEKTVALKSGEKVKFKGFLAPDGSGIQYDYLLNNRKAPKGSLEDVQSFDTAVFKELEKNIEAQDKELRKKLKEKAEAIKRKKLAYERSFLCKKPYGRKDQCAWIIESDKCYRTRCNVNGKWSDKTERPLGPNCQKKFVIKPCDY